MSECILPCVLHTVSSRPEYNIQFNLNKPKIQVHTIAILTVTAVIKMII